MKIKKLISSMIISASLAVSMFAMPVEAYCLNTVDTSMVSRSTSSCQIVVDQVVYHASLGAKPSSDDGRIYLYELKTYEYGLPAGATPIASCEASSEVNISFPLNLTYGMSRLYNKFVLAVKRGGVVTFINNAQYITNPEACAVTVKPREPRPAKALQKDYVANISLNGSGVALPIGAQHAVFTVEDPTVVVADPHQAGDTHPVKANPIAGYMMNADDEAGCAGLIADMTAYAESSYIQDYVIGNEVNERCWNNMNYCDWDTYVRKYVQAFRICYTAIKSVNPNARVYTSLDQVWNKNASSMGNLEYIDGDEFLSKFNDMILENGNIDWDLSIHPYPNPLYYAKFWDLSGLAGGENFKAQVDNNQVLTFQNMSIISGLLATPKYLNREGMVRDIIIGEIGLGSNAGLENQAAAICASYAAFERNPYITQYLYLEVDVNGFYPTMQGKARECFDAMGTPNEQLYMSWALNHIGISDWSQVIR